MALSTDPIDWLLAADGDVSLGPTYGADLKWTTGVAAVIQGIRVALQMIRGEWFLDDEEGVPYYERPGVPAADALIGQARFNELKAIAAFREAIERAPGVNQILKLSVSLNKATRKLSCVWAVRTVFGDSNPETTVVTVGGQ